MSWGKADENVITSRKLDWNTAGTTMRYSVANGCSTATTAERRHQTKHSLWHMLIRVRMVFSAALLTPVTVRPTLASVRVHRVAGLMILAGTAKLDAI
ncbi:MAG: hypothetical protein NVSMB22_26180 [Chloroflexota bacterium]